MNIRAKTVQRLMFLAVVGVVLLGALLAVRQYNESKKQSRLQAARDDGLAAFKRNDYPATLEKLRGYIKPNTTDIEALLAFATARWKVEQPDGRHLLEAKQWFELLRGLQPEDPNVERALLRIYSQGDFATEALSLADTVLARKKDDAEALRAKSIALLRLARYDEALAASHRWNEAAPFDLDGQLQTFTLLRRVRMPREQIIQKYEALLKEHPEDPRFEMLLALAYGEGGNRDKALQLLRSAAARPAPDADFVAQLARVFDQQRLFEDSAALLQRSAERSTDPAVLRVLVLRLWQNGQHDLVLTRLADLDPAAAASDSTLLALRAMSLLALDKKDQADSILSALKSRASDNIAQGWCMAITARIDAPRTPPMQLINKLTAAMARGGENGIVRVWLGDAHLTLGETEHAVREWRAAAELMPSWAEPHVKIARALLAGNHPVEAAEAALTAYRCAPEQVAPQTTLALARAALLQQNPSDAEQQKLAALVADIQRRKPGEPETLALHATMLCRAGKKEEAIVAIRNSAAWASNWEPDVLANVLAVSRENSLDLEGTILSAIAPTAEKSPRVALRYAIELHRSGRGGEAISVLQNGASRAASDALPWQIALAQYREATNDSDADATWVALGDANPEDFTVQSLILRSAASAQSDRAFFARTIDRVRKLVGDEGTLWRYARAKFLLAGTPSPRDNAEAVTLLTELIRAEPNVPEYHVRLAQAMENLGNSRDAANQLRVAAEIDPRSVGVQIDLARLLQEQGKHAEARDCLARAADSPSIQPQHRAPLAQLLAAEGQFAEAAAVLEGASSRDLETDLLLADLHRKLGQVEAAEKIFEQRLRTESSPDLLAAAADFFASRQQVDRARKILNGINVDSVPQSQQHAIWARFEERFGDAAAARKHYTQAAEQNPDDVSAWRRLAAFCARQGTYTDAVAAADRGLALAPQNVELQSLKLQAAAMAKVSAGSNDLSPLIDVLAQDPTRSAEATALRAMQETLATTQPTAAQISRLRQSADRFPRYLPLQDRLARAYLQAGLNEDAANVALRIMENQPGDLSAAQTATGILRLARQWAAMKLAAEQWRRLAGAPTISADLAFAESAGRLNQPREVLASLAPHLVNAARQPEQNAQLLQLAAVAMMSSGQTERTEDLLGPMLATSSTARLIWMRVIAESANDSVLAGEWLNRVQVSLDPKSYDEVEQFARAASVAAMRFGDPAPARGALELLKPYINETTPRAEAIFIAGSLYLQLGRTREAESMYRAVLQARPEHVDACNDLAYLLLLRRGDMKEARELAKRAVAKAPNIATFHETLARIEAELGNRAEALAEYDAALKLDPRNIDAMVGKAFLLKQMNQPQQARDLLSQIEPLLPTAPPLSEPVRVQLQQLRQTNARGDE